MLDDLRRAVIDHPDDDALRLVYADALQQQGDPRGEYIALALAGDPGAAAMLEQHRTAWTAHLPFAMQTHFERGFVQWVKLDANPEQRDRPLLAALDLEPIDGVALDNDGGDPDDARDNARWFASDPRTSRIRELSLAWMTWGEEACPLLFEADLSRLRELRFGDGDCNHAMPLVAKFPALEVLGFHGDYAADLDADMRDLAAIPFVGLRELELQCCGLTPRGGIALAASEHLGHLRKLSFTGGSYQANHIGDEGMLALVPRLAGLEQLSVGGNEISDALLLLLASDEAALPSLRVLAINTCPIGPRAMEAFARAPRFANIRELWAGGCDFGDAGAIAIATSPRNGALRALNAHGCGIGRDGLHALVALAPQLELLLIDRTPDAEEILRPHFGARLNPE